MEILTLPPPCLPDAVPDRYTIWRQLTELWIAKEAGRTNRKLAEHLDVSAQHLSQWKTGSCGKAPVMWHYIMILALELGLVVVLDPKEGARLHMEVPKEPEQPAKQEEV